MVRCGAHGLCVLVEIGRCMSSAVLAPRLIQCLAPVSGKALEAIARCQYG